MERRAPTKTDRCESPVRIDDFRTLAKTRIPSEIFDYIDCGACDEITTRSNRRDLNEIHLLPLCLRNVGEVDLSIDLLGHSFSLPIGFSPTAFHRLVHEGGEVSTAKAASTLNIPMIVSSMSSIALEDVAGGSGNKNLWFQTYIFKDRELTKSLVQRAEKSGYKSVVVSTGCPVAGKRDKNIVNRFILPKDVVAANFRQRNVVVHNNPIYSVDGAELDPSLTWKDIEWLRCNTELPIMLKGIMNPVDVAPALGLQVSALVLSNHGGRQLDTTESTIRILPEVAAAVSGRIPLLVDSGFRRGTDVLKAIALGADGVLLGRPVLWALAVDGEKGVVDAVNLLTDELRIAMQLAGCSNIDAIRKNSANIIRR
jgi:isopentenyl diphosphate isomerase/L-lactate dehydrogenase-like FMN-dependent dehydrogenase